MSEFKVSIRLMTYNHEAYIRQAMDGILMQNVSFPVEVVVGDDFSTDKTLEIIRSYASTDMIKIRVLEREKNDEYWQKRQSEGRLYNFENIIENCQGQYIALLDGDDYWCDPYKLEKQVRILDENEKIALVHTGHKILLDSKKKMVSVNKDDLPAADNYFESLLIRNRISTPTVMGRAAVIKKAILDIKEKVRIHKIMDYPLWLAISIEYQISYLEDITSVYRLIEHSESRPKHAQKKFDYIENVYRIKKRFIDMVPAAKELLDPIDLSYARKKLFYAFVMNDRQAAGEAVAQIRAKNKKLNFSDRLKALGAGRPGIHAVLTLFIKERNMI